jgi:PAS domain S-box-containing protein
MTPDFVCIAGKDGYFRKINNAVVNKLGYTREELFAVPISTFVHPDDKEKTRATRADLVDHGKTLLNFENRYLCKDGTIVWLEWTSIYFAETERVFAIAKDVTARKKIEKEVEEKYNKFKSLASHFKSTIELERRYLAIELHEELAQLASVVKMDIDWIRNNETAISVVAKERVDHALVIADLLISTIRRISFSVSPNMLHDLGLSATLEWHCTEFEKLNGIPCVFKGAYREEELSLEIKMDFFRICQEALTNIMYHAEASLVYIDIKDTGKHIQLFITDNGKGFDLSASGMRQEGLNSMRKRAASINAELTIQSESGKGTVIAVTLPK